MNIKEVALRIGSEMNSERDEWPGEEWDVEFALRLVAELQKDAEPVAWISGRYFERGVTTPLVAEVSLVNLNWPNQVALSTHPQPKAATVPLGMQHLGEMREGGVHWFSQNPHACPVGTQFYAAPSLPAQSTKAAWALKQIADLDPKTGSIGTAVFIAREALPAAQSEGEQK